MSWLLSDLRYAWRGLRRSPWFAAVSLASIALGVGASVAIFGAVNRVLLASLPYPDANRVVALSDVDRDGNPFDVAYGTYREVAERSRSFERLAVADRWRPALTAAGEPERLDGDRVSADYFRVLGVAPAFGRNFDPTDEQPGRPRVAIVSAALAKRRFGNVEALLNRPIRLDGDEYTVVGVMPPGFVNALASAAEVWTPLRYRAQAPFQSAEWGHHLRMVGRLGVGTAANDAERELRAIGGSPSLDFPRPPWASLENGLRVRSLQSSVTVGIRPMLLASFGAVLVLLVITCVNVSGLLLTRGFARRSELAVRTALGAGRQRLIRQLLAESVLLASIGGALGLIVASAVGSALTALAPAALSRWDTFRLDAGAFVFALALTTLVGLAIGLVPALGNTRDDLCIAVRSGARFADPRHRVWRRALVVTQVALALVLIASAGLLLRSVERLLATPPGFQASHVLTMQVVAKGRKYGSGQELAQFFERALDTVSAIPGVTDAAFTSQLPLSGDDDRYGVAFESVPLDGNDEAHRYTVTPAWFRTMGIPLLQGRLLGPEDRAGAPRAVLINESFAKRRFGDASPIGRRIRMGPDIGRDDRPWATIVGVVGDVKQTSLAPAAPNAFYVAMGQWNWVDDVQSLAVRSSTDPSALVHAVKRAIWSVDPTPPLVRVATMNELLKTSEAQRGFASTIFSAFGLAALALAVIGLYGVLAGSVAERTREIGVRSALGATRFRVASLVVREGMALTVIGIAFGLAGAAAATRALQSLLFGVEAFDVPAYGGAVAVLVAAALIACGVPALRAAKVDPCTALRAE